MIPINMTTAMKRKFQEKIRTYRAFDIEKKKQGVCDLTPDIIMDIIRQHDCRCVHCGDIVLLEYTRFCLYQFSLDRIDDDIAHVKDNLVIVVMHIIWGHPLRRII